MYRSKSFGLRNWGKRADRFQNKQVSLLMIARKHSTLKERSPLVGIPCDPYATPEELIFRVPANWHISAQEIGTGIKFTAPDGLAEWRVHAPLPSPRTQRDAPGRQGWVLRVTKFDPAHPLASRGRFPGWVSFNSLGEPVPNESDAAHIPIFGNPAKYDPLDFHGTESFG